jgi:hypothetical protein
MYGGGHLPDIERRRCPQPFQDLLTRHVGVNRYGDPNFIIAWGQSYFYTAGGHSGPDRTATAFSVTANFRSLTRASPEKVSPCWMILEWRAPEEYGTPAAYYYDNRDELTGLQTLGEYPYKGRYEIAYRLNSQEFRDGRMVVTNYHLDGWILDMLIPAILEGKRMDMKNRLRMLREADEKREKAEDDKIDDVIRNSKRKLLPSQIDDRVRLIQRQMSEMLKTVRAGFSPASNKETSQPREDG